jgi:hypothetical protein
VEENYHGNQPSIHRQSVCIKPDALPLTQPLPSLVILDAGVITTTQVVDGGEEPVVVELPVQGSLLLSVVEFVSQNTDSVRATE